MKTDDISGYSSCLDYLTRLIEVEAIWTQDTRGIGLLEGLSRIKEIMGKSNRHPCPTLSTPVLLTTLRKTL